MHYCCSGDVSKFRRCNSSSWIAGPWRQRHYEPSKRQGLLVQRQCHVPQNFLLQQQCCPVLHISFLTSLRCSSSVVMRFAERTSAFDTKGGCCRKATWGRQHLVHAALRHENTSVHSWDHKLMQWNNKCTNWTKYFVYAQNFVAFDVIKAVKLQTALFWDVMPWNLVDRYWCPYRNAFS
jgi:hypothetical protein